MNDDIESCRLLANQFLDVAFERTNRDIFLLAKAALASAPCDPPALLNALANAADREDIVIRAFMASAYRERKIVDLELFSLLKITEACRRELPGGGQAYGGID